MQNKIALRPSWKRFQRWLSDVQTDIEFKVSERKSAFITMCITLDRLLLT